MSEIKVNKISPRTACGTTTLGDSGDTFTIPAGVTITNNGTANGFGATGAVNWQTTVKTGNFSATAGEGYFVDTSSGAISVNLPAGTAGAVVGFKDYANTFDTANVTLVQNGTDKIGGSTVNATLATEGLAVTLVFIDSTKGWLVTDSGLQADAPTEQYVAATGGTVTTVCTNFKVHTFTGPGNFCVSCAGNSQGSNTVDYLVIAGGGSGGADLSGGGGAGGYRFSNGTASGSYCAGPSPLGASALPVAAQCYPITVGGGGAGAPSPSPGTGGTKTNGSDSIFSSITSAGGGFGASYQATTAGNPGGSGGGGNAAGLGSGNTPSVSPPQGNNGGSGGGGNPFYQGGGGGAGGVGGNGVAPKAGGPGGNGLASSITGSAVTRGGGGGAGQGYNSGTIGTGGPGGGGAGVNQYTGSPGNPGTVNTGGGGGGGGDDTGGGNGGSGLVIIRYKFQG
jgi:hypothetical protein